MPSETIDELAIEISSNASNAVSGIDSLKNSLVRLKEATKGGIGLGSISKQVSALRDATTGFDPNAPSTISGIATAIRSLSGLKISSALTRNLTNLGSALSSLSTVNTAAIINVGTAANSLTALSSLNLSGAIRQLRRLPEALSTLGSLDLSQFATQIRTIANTLTPLAARLSTITNGFNTLTRSLGRYNNISKRTATQNSATALSFLSLYAKVRMAYYAVKTIATAFANMVETSIDYVETIQMMGQVMKQYSQDAYDYANTVSELMGIDPAEWLDYQSTLMALANGFGITTDKAYLMSQQLTQLGYDIAAFKNMDVEDAMVKVRGIMSGEVEPPRSVGIDISEAALKLEAANLGITKTYNEMTQAEKATLRYVVALKQSVDMQGTMARELNNPASQLRILRAQLTILGRTIGNLFIPLLNRVLPYLIAITKTLTAIVEMVGSLAGIDMNLELEWDGSVTEDIASSNKEAEKSAESLKRSLMGFDEINLLQKDSSTDIESMSDGFDVKLPTYDFLGEATQEKVDAIVDKFKEWLGITGDIDSWADFFNTKLGTMLKTVGLIGAGLLAWKISESVINTINSINTFAAGGKVQSFTIGIILSIAGLALEGKGIASSIENGLGLDEALEEVLGGGMITVGAAELGAAFGSAFIGGAVGAIVAGIGLAFTGIYDMIVNKIDWLNALVTVAGTTAAGAGIGAIIGACGGPIGAGIGALIGLAVGALIDGSVFFFQHFDEIKQFIKDFFMVTIPGLWTDFKAKIVALPQTIEKWFDDLWRPIEEFDWVQLGYDMGEWLGNAVRKMIDFVFVKVPTWLDEAYTSVKQWFEELPQNIWNDIKTGWDTIVGIGKSIIDGIYQGLVAKYTAIIKWLAGFIKGFRDSLGLNKNENEFKNAGKTTMGSFWDGLKSKWETMKTWLSSVAKTILGVFGNIFNSDSNYRSIGGGYVSAYASGGFPKDGQLFIAREAGAELVGNIGGRTAVANNDQIVEGISSGVRDANDDVVAAIYSMATQIVNAVNGKDMTVSVGGRNLAKEVTSEQNRMNRMYGHSLQNA